MAERLLSHHLNDSSTPLLDCLGAAYAAEQRGDENARNRYLEWAREHDPDHLVAVEVTRARFLERAGQIAQARQVLEALHDQGHRSRALQGLLVKLLHQEGDWDALEKVLNDSRRSKLLSAEQTKALTRELGVARLMTEAQGPGDGVSAAWRRLSRKERNDAGYVATYARVLISERRMNQAEQLLRRAIYRQWNTELVSLYGLAHSDRLEEQIRMAETWATAQERSPELLMTLARLYLEKGEKEKAIALLMETSRQDASQRYAMELGLLLESMGRSADALQCYRRGIEGLMADAVSTLDNPDLLSVEASANANFGSQFLALGRHTNVSAPNSKES
jgi:HemY protein